MRPRMIATVALLILAPHAAWAGMPVMKEMKCPVGGKKFTYETTASFTRWGSRPDGKPYGSWVFPLAFPVCPDNGLVVYGEFSPDEVEILKPLVASDTYQAMRKVDTPYYLAQWLMREFDAPPQNVLWMLLQASWEADGNAALKARYQREYVELAAKYPKPESGDDLDWIVTQARAVNALRELGQFDAALALQEKLPLHSLDVPVPEEKVSGTTPSGLGKQIENGAQIRAAEARRSWIAYFDKMKVVIQRGDASAEPLDMIPARVAAEHCMKQPDLSKPEIKSVCESEPVTKAMAQMRR
jgi:hypothetical protein